MVRLRRTTVLHRSRTRCGMAVAFVAAAACTVPAQAAPSPTAPAMATPQPVVSIAFAAQRDRSATPAVAWLRDEVLTHRREWPRERDSSQPFTVHVGAGSLRFTDGVALPPGCIAAGEATLDGCTLGFDCLDDGSESWVVEGTRVPARVRALLAVLHVDLDGAPRTIDVAALVGNLAGAAVADDASMQQLTAGALLCGDAVVTARHDARRLHVNGRSAGGLMVPAFLLWQALAREAGMQATNALREWQLRAFVGRDGDRLEAVRQMQRSGGNSLPALRAMLHGDESIRLCAMDALVRLQAAGELPPIVTAADATMPLATAMATTAVRELWPLAAADTRERTRGALGANPVLEAALQDLGQESTRDPRWRLLGFASILLVSLSGFWLRERTRLS